MIRMRHCQAARVLALLCITAAPRIVLARAGHEGRHERCEGRCAHGEGPGEADGEHHGHRLGIHHLLEGITLRPEQRVALMRLHREAMDDRELVHAATKPFREELAREVRSGRIDEGALEKLRVKVAADVASLPPVHVTMLAKLHGILDPSQRALVAEKLEKASPEAHEPPAEGRGHGRHHGAHGHEQGRDGSPGAHRLRRLAEELDLKPSQRDAIGVALNERMRTDAMRVERQAMRAEMEKRHADLAARFRADAFSVTEADKIPAALAAGRIAHMSAIAIVATPTLTTNQRLKLAEAIERGRRDDEP